ncbi:MAG: hypothetical protein EXR92_00380 [Gemmatimonadetes bacterium]|nr:hypothetical protein [Gemmatimonadota bacterium]
MDADIQKEADLRLAGALERTGARDPREAYRDLLKELRGRSKDAYEEAVREYRTTVLEPIAEAGADPVQAWLEFGCRLAKRLHPGQAVVLNEAGRARPLEPPPGPDALILHVPEERRARAMILGMPRELTPAQRAAVDLLALGKVKLQDA